MLIMSYQHNLNSPININMQHFITTLFKGIHCHIDIHENVANVKLTKEIDKAIMNRPFYWQYTEAMGKEGKPSTLTFSIDGKSDEGEKLFVGGIRFRQLCQFLHSQSIFTKMFEQINTEQNVMLHPWLLVNALITYEGKQMKEKLQSIGLNLINGTVIENFMDLLKEKELQQTISNHCYTISPIISLPSGYKRIEQLILKQITSDQHSWAVDSYKTLQDELRSINELEKIADLQHIVEKERELTVANLQPKISYNVYSGGLIFLKASSVS